MKSFKRLESSCLYNRCQNVDDTDLMLADLKRCLNHYYVIWVSQSSDLGGELTEKRQCLLQNISVKLYSRKWKIEFLATFQCQQSWNHTQRVWCYYYSIDNKLRCVKRSGTEGELKLPHFQLESWILFSSFSQSSDILTKINWTVRKWGQIQMFPSSLWTSAS